ncbi:hypothetical protein SERLA73DRAFT_180089 [Serpula lacrymans var. lacrymans S7.3]|uniref:Uncharacterized protein n=1 Tax=Serpula lacrymans var. lacrymans (strain S7.3) TaxID=936435 RepID=F8PVN0_SERL3|nr:hypothetical protein SERLA73DRAFT_180089 [Serpula lacrymans var. lacrymans S7.3]
MNSEDESVPFTHPPPRVCPQSTTRITDPRCHCIWCRRRPRVDDVVTPHSRNERIQRRSSQRRHHLPTTNSIMEVLYPSSLTAADSPDLSLERPPAYEECPPHGSPSSAVQDTFSRPNGQTAEMPLIENEGVADSNARDAPLAFLPLVTGDRPPCSDWVVSNHQGPINPQECRYISHVDEHQFPSASIDEDIAWNNRSAVSPPTYARFDPRRPRFPNASEILGPYPHISVLSPEMS